MFPSPHRPSLASSSNHPHPNNINGVNNNGLNGGYHHHHHATAAAMANGYAQHASVVNAATRTPEQSPRLRETNANLQQIGRHRDKLELIRNDLRRHHVEQPLPNTHPSNDHYSNGYGNAAYEHQPTPERQSMMLNTLTQLGFEKEAAFYALALVKFSSVGAAAELLKILPRDQLRGANANNYAPHQYAPQTPQQQQFYNNFPASYYSPQGYNLTTTTTFSAVPGGAPSTQQHITAYRLPPPPPMTNPMTMAGPPPVVGIPHHMIDDSGSSRSDSPAAAPSPPITVGNGRSSPQTNGRGLPTVRNHHIALRQSNSIDHPEIANSRKVEHPVFQATGGTVINIDNSSHLLNAQKTRAAAKVVSVMKARIPQKPLEAVSSMPSMGHYRLEQRNSDTSNHHSEAKQQSSGVQSILVDPDNGITDLVDQLRKNQRDSVASAASDGSFMQQLLQEQVQTHQQQQQQQSAEEQNSEVVRCVSPIPESTIRKVNSPNHEYAVKPCKAGMFRFFMEQHIERLIQQYKERILRAQQLAKEMEQAGLNEQMREQMLKFLAQKESKYCRLKRQKMNKEMFEIMKTIGIGAFGQVSLVKKKDTKQLYAMKKLSKKDVIMKQQAAHVKAERDILAEANSSWIVKLYYSFQDSNFLYFVLEFVPGGDLMTLLCREDFFTEKIARFYTAELACAIEYVHKLGFIHRDIKPDNILIDKDGHIKLTDFGLCTGLRWTHDKRHYGIEDDPNHVRYDSFSIPQNLVDSGEQIKLLEYRNHKRRYQAHSVVGTCNYMAPEVIQKKGHTQLCDWWSVGVILYEMVFGRPPFLAPHPDDRENTVVTQQMIINWRTTLRLNAYLNDGRWSPPSEECIDIIRRLLCDQEDRLGIRGAQEVKQHAWFKGIDFANLRSSRAEVVPRIDHAEDTQNFDPPDLPSQCFDTLSKKLTPQQASNPAFYEFTFRHFFDYDGQGCPSLKIQKRPSLAPLLNSSTPPSKPSFPLHEQFNRLHTNDGPNVRNVPILVQKGARRGPVTPAPPVRPRFDQFLEEEDSDDSLVV